MIFPKRFLPRAVGIITISRRKQYVELLERFKFEFARGSGKENQRNSDFSRKKCEFDDSTPHQPWASVKLKCSNIYRPTTGAGVLQKNGLPAARFPAKRATPEQHFSHFYRRAQTGGTRKAWKIPVRVAGEVNWPDTAAVPPAPETIDVSRLAGNIRRTRRKGDGIKNNFSAVPHGESEGCDYRMPAWKSGRGGRIAITVEAVCRISWKHRYDEKHHHGAVKLSFEHLPPDHWR